MGMALGGGTHANLELDPALGEAIRRDATPRFIKATIDGKAEKIVCAQVVNGGDSLKTDFALLNDLLVDKEPAIVVINCQDEPEGGGDKRMVMLGWTPSGSPVKLRTLSAASRKTMASTFGNLQFKEWNITEREEVTYDACVSNLRELTDAERMDCMTREEYIAEGVRRDLQSQQNAAPARLAGMAAVKVGTQPSFEPAIKAIEPGCGSAAIATLAGDTSEELAAEVVGDVATPADLRGKLSTDTPCYVVLPGADNCLLFVAWQPEGAKLKLKMKASTFKASAIELVRQLSGKTVLTAEVTDPEELTAELGAQAEAAAVKAPPAGAVGLPGMGGGGFKPPAGGFKLPGMGS